MTSQEATLGQIKSAEGAAVAARVSPLALLGWMGFVTLVVWAIFIGGSGHGIYLVLLRTISLTVVAVVLGAWFVISLRRPDWRAATAIWPTLVIPVATLALATLASRMPRLGLEYVAWAILLVALYLLLVRILATDLARDRIGGLAAMLALVLGLVYIGTVVVNWLEWWGLVGRLAMPPLRPLYAGLTLGSPSVVLTVEVLLTAVAYGGLGLASQGRRTVLAVVTIVSVTVVVLTGSRAGWLAAAGAIFVIGGIWVLAALRSGQLAHLVRQRNVRIALGLTVVACFAVAVVVAPAVLLRVSDSGDGGRIQYFTTAWRMFEDAPLLGTGPGTWAVQRVAYTEPGELDWYIPHAHDMYLQTMAELGVVGLLAGLIALVPVGWLIYRGMRSVAAPASRRWAWAAFFSLTFVGLSSVLDFYIHLPAVMLVAAIPVAVLDGASERRIGLGALGERSTAWMSRIALATLWVACLASVVVLARAESVAWTHQVAVAATNEGDWDAASGPADEAAASDPDMNAYQMTRGLAAAGRRDWVTAADAYGRAASVDDMPQSWLGLAQAQVELGAPTETVARSLERALRSGSQQPAVVYAAGYLYDRIGMIDQADAAYAAALAAYPSLAVDETWADDPDLAPRWPGIMERAAASAPGRAWEIAL
ncbi:MAG TPA: O-antigen ligase family protein, partial [Candidatus Limnocylindrales bacterium]|nr:O-antigen ligase family protein [Candidatus Limnocylindrales bacterium]